MKIIDLSHFKGRIVFIILLILGIGFIDFSLKTHPFSTVIECAFPHQLGWFLFLTDILFFWVVIFWPSLGKLKDFPDIWKKESNNYASRWKDVFLLFLCCGVLLSQFLLFTISLIVALFPYFATSVLPFWTIVISLLILTLRCLFRLRAPYRNIALLPWAIGLLLSIILYKTDIPPIQRTDFPARESEFETVVQLVQSNQLKPDEYGNIKLPWRYRHLANRGNRYFYGGISIKTEDNAQVIRFVQQSYGFGDGINQVIYRSDHKDISIQWPDGYNIVKLKDHWFSEDFNKES